VDRSTHPGRRRALARGYGRSARLRAREVTAPLRALPDFLIIGAQKAGTTSLYAYLCAHPDVLPAARKEVHYFDLNHARGERWYRSMFPLRADLEVRARRAGHRVVTGEASPYYLFHPLAAERAASTVPGTRLVVLLRDPVQRAWSHYRHEVAAGREPLGFTEALDAEPGRLDGADDAVRAGGPPDLVRGHRWYSYVARGLYADQLRRWLEVFPREQLLVLTAEDLFTEPRREWARTAGFLGLDGAAPPTFRVHNPGTPDALDPAVRERLGATFARPNRDLAELLGHELPWG
jgi:hypothetical protein